jgi:hypothetical protein
LYFTWHDNGEYFIQKHGEPESNVVKTIDPFNLIGGTVIKYRELSYRAEKVFFAIWENGEEHIWAEKYTKIYQVLRVLGLECHLMI